MCLKAKPLAIFDVNHNLILQYSTSVWYQVICFSHNTYIEKLLLELRLNSYKVGVICSMYRRMREKWTSWARTRHHYKYWNSPPTQGLGLSLTLTFSMLYSLIYPQKHTQAIKYRQIHSFSKCALYFRNRIPINN